MHAPHLVLLGDSIFDNRAYVKSGQSVAEQLQPLLGADGRVTLRAVDGQVAVDVDSQLRELPSSATHLVLSVGGNDALGCLPTLEAPCRSVIEALTVLGELQAQFARVYRNALLGALEAGRPLMVCTIYDHVPGLPSPLKAALSLFNDVITRMALEFQTPVLDLRDLLQSPDDYSKVSPIEPSEQGGQKIALALRDWCMGRASS